MNDFEKYSDGFHDGRTSSLFDARHHFQNSETKGDYDERCDMVALLDNPVVGMRVVLETGQEWKIGTSLRVWSIEDDIEGVRTLPCVFALPLLRAAVSLGAKVVVPYGFMHDEAHE